MSSAAMTDQGEIFAAHEGKPTGCIALADGSLFFGRGFGATGVTVGELCFNTAMTGYQEILTDPSYAGQIVTFTFPHIGNVGVNADDVESHEGERAGGWGVGVAVADFDDPCAGGFPVDTVLGGPRFIALHPLAFASLGSLVKSLPPLGSTHS